MGLCADTEHNNINSLAEASGVDITGVAKLQSLLADLRPAHTLPLLQPEAEARAFSLLDLTQSTSELTTKAIASVQLRDDLVELADICSAVDFARGPAQRYDVVDCVLSPC